MSLKTSSFQHHVLTPACIYADGPKAEISTSMASFLLGILMRFLFLGLCTCNLVILKSGVLHFRFLVRRGGVFEKLSGTSRTTTVTTPVLWPSSPRPAHPHCVSLYLSHARVTPLCMSFRKFHIGVILK